jgi:hypothetical protein
MSTDNRRDQITSNLHLMEFGPRRIVNNFLESVGWYLDRTQPGSPEAVEAVTQIMDRLHGRTPAQPAGAVQRKSNSKLRLNGAKV